MGGIAALKAAIRLHDARRAAHCKGLFNAAAREYPLEAAAGCTQSTSVRRPVVDSRAAGRDKLTKSVTMGATTGCTAANRHQPDEVREWVRWHSPDMAYVLLSL